MFDCISVTLSNLTKDKIREPLNEHLQNNIFMIVIHVCISCTLSLILVYIAYGLIFHFETIEGYRRAYAIKSSYNLKDDVTFHENAPKF